MNGYKSPRHLVVRYGDVKAPAPGTIAVHKEIIERTGYVWLAKFGRPIGLDVLKLLNDQVAVGTRTIVYLVTRVATGARRGSGAYSVAAATLEEARRQAPGAASEREHIPRYYIRSQTKTWLKLRDLEEQESSVLGQFVIASSGMPLWEAIYSSMAGAFMIRQSAATLQNLSELSGEPRSP